MKYDLLVRKLHTTEEKYITSEKIKEYCEVLGISYKEGIVYLTRTKHLHTILRGIFYKPSIEERKFHTLKVNYLEAVSKALSIKGIKKWYFGLETEIKFNNLSHEFFAADYILNDSIARTKPMTILGNKILFLKIKPKLFSFGIKKKNKINYSDTEKTLLDIIYLKKYSGLKDDAVMDSVSSYINKASISKLKEYALHYNKKVEALVKRL